MEDSSVQDAVQEVDMEDAQALADAGMWEQAAETYGELINKYTKTNSGQLAAECCVSAAEMFLKMTPPDLVRAADRLQSGALIYFSIGKKKKAAKCEEKLARVWRRRGHFDYTIASYNTAYRWFKEANCALHASYCKQEGVAIIREMRAQEESLV